MKKIYLLMLICCTCITSYATTYYWVGTSGTNWNTANSWNTASDGSGTFASPAPGNTDDLIIDRSTTIIMNASYQANSFIISGANIVVVLQNNTNATSYNFTTDNGSATTPHLLVPSSCELVLRGTGTGACNVMYLSRGGSPAAPEAIINGTITTEGTGSATSSSNSRIDASNGHIQINGTYNMKPNCGNPVQGSGNNIITMGPNSLLDITEAGSFFLPDISFNATSTLSIRSTGSGTISNLNSSTLSYGNILVNATIVNGASNANLALPSTTVINGYLRLISAGTGSGSLRLVGNTPGTITIKGLMSIEGGNFAGTAASSTMSSHVINAEGGFAISSGTFDLSQNTTGTANNLFLNIAGGDFNQTGGVITESGISTDSRIRFTSGTAAQSLLGTLNTTNDVSVEINKLNNQLTTFANNVGLSTNANARFRLTNGKVDLNGNTLTLNNGSPATSLIGGSVDSYVYNGTLIREMSDAASTYVFPVGSQQYYYPAKIVPTDAASNFSVRFYNNYPTNAPITGDPTPGIETGLIAPYYWDIQISSGTSADGISLGYTNIAAGVLVPANAKVVHLKTDVSPDPMNWYWETLGGLASNGPGGCTPTADCAFIDAVSDLPWSAFSPFTLAGNVNVLPVDINSFIAQKINNNSNSINWRASCNVLNEATFEVQRSTDGVNFITIYNETASKARCASPFSYTDNYNATSAITYYRLKVTGVVGEAKYSTIAAVNNKGGKLESVMLYPTVVKNNATVLVQSTQNNTTGNFVVTNATGAVVAKFTKGINEGSNVVNIETAYLAAGIYQLTTYINGVITTLRFVKQ
jgi:hypothetical protein